MATRSYKEVEEMVKFMGGTTKLLINWFWAENFASKDLAQSFVNWLEDHGFEHRGICVGRDNPETFSVRYRM